MDRIQHCISQADWAAANIIAGRLVEQVVKQQRLAGESATSAFAGTVQVELPSGVGCNLGKVCDLVLESFNGHFFGKMSLAPANIVTFQVSKLGWSAAPAPEFAQAPAPAPIPMTTPASTLVATSTTTPASTLAATSAATSAPASGSPVTVCRDGHQLMILSLPLSTIPPDLTGYSVLQTTASQIILFRPALPRC